MRLGKVIGKVVLSQQDPAYHGGRFLVVMPTDKAQLRDPARPMPDSQQPSVVVYDNLGAGTGDLIGFVEGAEATEPFDHPMPVDALAVSLLDHCHYQPA
jgi:microcompartment protein CcmK/EutM